MTKLFEIVLIETKNTCTRKCWFCKFGQERQDAETVEMSWQTIEKIVQNLKELKYSGRISWFWINEPLLDKRLFELVRLTRKECPRAFLSLITNGDLLSERTYARLREDGLDALGVSIYDDETFEKISSMQKDNRLVLLDMRQPIGIIENRAGSIRTHAELFENSVQDNADRPCGRPSNTLVINTAGQVVLCCSDMYSEAIMGDVTTHRLEEIWVNEHFQRYREALARGARSELKLCNGCSHNGKAGIKYYPFKKKPDQSLLETAATKIAVRLGIG